MKKIYKVLLFVATIIAVGILSILMYSKVYQLRCDCTENNNCNESTSEEFDSIEHFPRNNDASVIYSGYVDELFKNKIDGNYSTFDKEAIKNNMLETEFVLDGGVKYTVSCDKYESNIYYIDDNKRYVIPNYTGNICSTYKLKFENNKKEFYKYMYSDYVALDEYIIMTNDYLISASSNSQCIASKLYIVDKNGNQIYADESAVSIDENDASYLLRHKFKYGFDIPLIPKISNNSLYYLGYDGNCKQDIGNNVLLKKVDLKTGENSIIESLQLKEE